MEDLLAEGFDYILTSRLQSDPIERRFSQYRSMSGGRFLVSLREVSTSEKILGCRSLLKLGENYWLQEEAENTDEDGNVDALVRDLGLEEVGIMEPSLCDSSKEVVHCIAGGIAKKLQKKNKCESCSTMMIADSKSSLSKRGSYLKTLSRGGLTNPSDEMSDFVCTVFAQTEFIDKHMNGQQSVRKVCCLVLEKYAPN